MVSDSEWKPALALAAQWDAASDGRSAWVSVEASMSAAAWAEVSEKAWVAVLA